MNRWTVTRVWEIDEHLIVAPTVEEAIALFKTYMGKDYRGEPSHIVAVSNSVCFGKSYTALIKEEEK